MSNLENERFIEGIWEELPEPLREIYHISPYRISDFMDGRPFNETLKEITEALTEYKNFRETRLEKAADTRKELQEEYRRVRLEK